MWPILTPITRGHVIDSFTSGDSHDITEYIFFFIIIPNVHN